MNEHFEHNHNHLVFSYSARVLLTFFSPSVKTCWVCLVFGFRPVGSLGSDLLGLFGLWVQTCWVFGLRLETAPL